MTLLETQQLFAGLSVKLLAHILEKGYRFTYGETYRDPRIASLDAKEGKGITDSLHEDRLAIDLNLFKDSVYLTSTESHRPFGEYWKSLHVLARWGGDFHKKDGNHYSLEFQGRK